MRSIAAIAALSGLALVSAQNPPAPTPSNAVTIEGDASYDGPVIKGTTGKLGNAAVVSNNPAGVVYKATLPNSKTSGVRGSVTASSASQGLSFSVSLSGLPSSDLGPFIYHIHAMPVPADGNCTATGPHLDPYVRGAIPPCDNTAPATCQVGDLSGKHGNITSDPFTASYMDPYVSDMAGNVASLVGKSLVVHSANTTRLNCANFVLANSSTSNTTTTSSNGTTSATPKASSFVGGAATNAVGYGAVVAGLIGVAAFFL